MAILNSELPPWPVAPPWGGAAFSNQQAGSQLVRVSNIPRAGLEAWLEVMKSEHPWGCSQNTLALLGFFAARGAEKNL